MDYNTFMATHSIKKGSTLKYTHTRIGDKELNIYPGSYNIPANELDEFHKLYYDYVFRQGKKEYLTEKQDGNCIAVDFDFRYEHSTCVRQHNSDTIDNIVCLYTETLKKFFVFDERPFNIYIFEKPNVNQLEDGTLTKDGIHMIIDMKMPHHLQVELRNKILKELENENNHVFAELPLLNNNESVLDEGISKGGTNWQLYGSRKPGYEAYQLTYWFACMIDKADNEFGIENKNINDFDFENDFNKLSVQYHLNNEFQYTQYAMSIQSSDNKSKKPIKKLVIENDDETDGEHSDSENQKLTKNQELLKLIKINPKDRKTWMRVCACIKYNNMKNKDWLQFGKDNNLNMDKEKLDLFGKLTNAIEIDYLQSLAKNCDLKGYQEWLDKWNIYNISVDDLDDPHKVATIISKTLKDTLKLCKENWYMLTENQLWKQQKEPSYYIINELKLYIDESNKKIVYRISQSSGEEKEKFIEISKKYLKSYKTISNSGYLNVLTKYLKTKLTDDTFADKLDNGLYKMVYKNGILDLKTMEFEPKILPCDYVTKTIPFDYKKPSDKDLDEIREILKQICNYNDEHLEYYLSTLGYAFTSDTLKEQNFWYLRGQTASNGKSIIFEALEELMPNYVIKATSDVLDKGADNRKEISTWKGIKLLWLNEVSTKKKDEELVKAVCDGTGYKYNRLYSTDAIIMPITFKLFAVSNNSLNIKSDAGVTRRFKLEQLNSHFSDYETNNYSKLQFKKDKSLPTKLQNEYRDALIYLILTYSHKYWNEKCLKPYPKEWETEAADNMADNNKFQSWFEENMEIIENGETYKKEIENMLQNTPLRDINIRDEIERMRLPIKYNSQQRGTGINKGMKGCFVGIKIKENENDSIQSNA